MELKFGGQAHYTVAGSPGIAYYLVRYNTEWTEEAWTLFCDDPDCDHEGPECYLYSEPEEIDDTSRVIAVMVGDDRRHVIDVEDLTEIGEGDYCLECGSTVCTAVRSDED